MIFVEDDDLLGKSKGEEADITVNTNHICAYNEGKTNDITMLRMANGECYPCPLNIQEFEEFLSKTENIIAIKQVSEN
jgi:hypothetical protein